MKTLYNEDLNGLEVYFDTKPTAAIITGLKSHFFRWHNVKKCWYAKKTQERENFLKSLGVSDMETVAGKTESTTAKEKINKYGVKVGDVFRMSWGYNMTINDFYQVTKICGAVKIEMRKLKNKRLSGDGWNGRETYIKDSFEDDKILTKNTSILNDNTIRIYMQSYADAYLIREENKNGYYYNNCD